MSQRRRTPAGRDHELPPSTRATGAAHYRGALCDARNPAQQFTIIPNGKGSYGISNNSAYLQHSPTNGLIFEELGDARCAARSGSSTTVPPAVRPVADFA
ncbi:hypothetical protein AB0J90_13995 [Micromonospora sp. NPDC049523]|uniref:hypothetical protein n=1 Tax=Micromonospora sp. NPDC049523 TaxID=3155921 RepID=UPI00343D01A4